TYDEQYQKALALAFEQAKGKAEALAPVLSSGEDTTLTLTSLTESPSSMQYRYADAGGFTAMDAVASASDVEQAKVNATVVPGTIDIEATVIAEYSLLDPSVINEAIASLAGASYEASELFS
ncbi:MAG: SIMPL domain-containing protein, partial [Coriobacteriia bacterium]|nr:SIMPL domain-containing protein [Coriobacteriia bacterium]